MLCMNSHKFSTSTLARYVVHVLKAVAILTGEYRVPGCPLKKGQNWVSRPRKSVPFS